MGTEPGPEAVANAGRPPAPDEVRARLEREHDPGVQLGKLVPAHDAVALCRIVNQEIIASESLQDTEVLKLPEQDRRSADAAQVAVRKPAAFQIDSETVGRLLQVFRRATVATDATGDPQFVDWDPSAIVRQHDAQRRRSALPNRDLLDGRRLAKVNDEVTATMQPFPDGLCGGKSHRY